MPSHVVRDDGTELAKQFCKKRNGATERRACLKDGGLKGWLFESSQAKVKSSHVKSDGCSSVCCHSVLGWRWDAEQTSQVWASCGDQSRLKRGIFRICRPRNALAFDSLWYSRHHHRLTSLGLPWWRRQRGV